MDLIADRGRRVSVEELNTSACWRTRARRPMQRKLDDMLIVDVDAHHYENEHMAEILPFMENDVLAPARDVRPRRHRAAAQFSRRVSAIQDMGGRVTRYPLRGTRKDRPTEGPRRRSSAIAGWTR